MLFFIISMISALSIFTRAAPAGFQVDVFRRAPRPIIDGDIAKVNEFPFIASLEYKDNRLFCAGSLLSKDTVVTSAQCVDTEKEERIQVRLGSLVSSLLLLPV